MNKKKNFKITIPENNSKKKPGNKFGKTLVTFLVSLLCTAVLIGCSAVTIDYIMNSKLIPEDPGSTKQDPGVGTPVEIKEKQINILLCGIDSGTNRTTNLTDVIMVANLDFVNKSINILQIPRDTYVGFDTVYTGKINAVYNAGSKGKGINGLVNAINESFKINIDYYLTMNLDGFRSIVESIGGVPITLETDFYFQEDGFKDITLKAGYHVLNGRQAEAFVRERNLRGSDIERAKQGQRVFMAAFIDKMMSLNKMDLITKTLPKLFDFVKTDFTLGELSNFADAVLSMDKSNISFDMVPGEGYYDTTHRQSLYAVHLDPFVEIINSKFRQHLNKITKNDLGIEELVNHSSKYDDNTADVDSIIGKDKNNSNN